MHLRRPTTEFVVVGLGKGGRQFHHFDQDDTITIEKEPNNPYDKKAIKVMANDTFVGYIARQYTKEVHQFLNRLDKEQQKHLFQFYLLDKYSLSARFLLIDLTLAMKRKQKLLTKK